MAQNDRFSRKNYYEYAKKVNLGMNRKLIDIPLGELLDKFGAASHKPGSGNADIEAIVYAGTNYVLL
jgi:hypothetical protein